MEPESDNKDNVKAVQVWESESSIQYLRSYLSDGWYLEEEKHVIPITSIWDKGPRVSLFMILEKGNKEGRQRVYLYTPNPVDPNAELVDLNQMLNEDEGYVISRQFAIGDNSRSLLLILEPRRVTQTWL
jgi:hypothetical protein